MKINSRKDYNKGSLSKKNLPKDPLDFFDELYTEANQKIADLEPYAFVLSTYSKKLGISSRVILLRGYDENGFIFYTNYKSFKGITIEENNNVCMNFFWQPLEKQIRIRGNVIKLSEKKSDQYFSSRPHKSRIAAWASNQSKVISSRKELEAEYKKLVDKYGEKQIPRPKTWGGYIIEPSYYEFWSGKPSRLHDRIVYKKINNNWEKYRLCP